MPDTGNAKDCLELPPTNFSIFTLKNVTWRTYLISFTVQYCFLFRFVCIELVSLIWFLQIWVAIYVYGTMINWSTLIKKLMQTYIVIVSGSILNVSTVHLNGIWHLIWRYLSKPVLGGHPVLSGHYSIPRGCPLNTGFVKSLVSCKLQSYGANSQEGLPCTDFSTPHRKLLRPIKMVFDDILPARQVKQTRHWHDLHSRHTCTCVTPPHSWGHVTYDVTDLERFPISPEVMLFFLSRVRIYVFWLFSHKNFDLGPRRTLNGSQETLLGSFLWLDDEQ